MPMRVGESDSDLQYQDEIHGPLIEQIDKAMELIYIKYMKAVIRFRLAYMKTICIFGMREGCRRS